MRASRKKPTTKGCQRWKVSEQEKLANAGQRGGQVQGETGVTPTRDYLKRGGRRHEQRAGDQAVPSRGGRHDLGTPDRGKHRRHPFPK